MQADFDETVFTCDLAVAKDIENVCNLIRENNIVIFLKKDDIVTQLNLKQKFEHSELNIFFGNSIETIRQWGEKITEKLADIVVDIDGLNVAQTQEKIIIELKNINDFGS